MEKHETAALEFFNSGYNCAQSVLLAFAGEAGLDRETAAKLALSFGGGLGGLGEVCGAFSGACMAAGLLLSPVVSGDAEAKAKHYAAVARMGEAFRREAGSLLCRDLKPEDLAERERVCNGCVALAARLLAKELGA